MSDLLRIVALIWLGCAGFVLAWFLFLLCEGAVRAHRNRWSERTRPEEPECYMPVLARRERIANRGHSPITWTIAASDDARAIERLLGDAKWPTR